LGLAYGITLTSSRLGSILNFLITPTIEATSGVPFSLWFGALLCLFSVVMACVFYMLDEQHEQTVGRPAERLTTRRLEWRSVLRFPLAFWILSLITMTFYVCVFAFIADASAFFQSKYQMEPTTAGYYAGLAYDISIIGAPCSGILLDRFARRSVAILLGACVAFPCFLIFLFSDVSPALGMTLLGIAYSIESAALWSSIPLLVDLNVIGVAGGVTTSIQMFGVGVGNLVVGALSNDGSFVSCLWFFVGVITLTVALSVLLLLIDLRGERVLWRGQRQIKQEEITPLLVDSIESFK